MSTLLCFLTSDADIVETTLQIIWKLVLQEPQGDHRSLIFDQVSELSKAGDNSLVHVLSECVLYVLASDIFKGLHMVIYIILYMHEECMYVCTTYTVPIILYDYL